MKRFKVDVCNEPRNLKFSIDLLATDAEHAKAQAFPYASEKIASFVGPLRVRMASRSAQLEEVAKAAAEMTDDSQSPPFWNPATMTVHVEENTDPVISFSWDLINKPNR